MFISLNAFSCYFSSIKILFIFQRENKKSTRTSTCIQKCTSEGKTRKIIIIFYTASLHLVFIINWFTRQKKIFYINDFLIAHLRRKHKFIMYDLCQLPNISCWISQDIRGLWKSKMVADFGLISEKQDKSKSINMYM